jgi:protoheme IX farnesyltransferase
MVNKTAFKNFLILGKASISSSVALTTATGYILSQRDINLPVIFPVIGVYLLAMSASIINQIIEMRADSLMSRTQVRPLVNKSVSVTNASIISSILGLSGFTILLIFNGLIPALLGLFTLVWYNAVYTPLKYHTAFAAFPGGLTGAIPPVIGWVAGGGEILHPCAIALATFLFIGQIPHFWLILLKFGEEYHIAGIKTITQTFSTIQIKRLILVWILATALAGILLAFFLFINHLSIFYIIHLLSLSLVLYFILWFIKSHNRVFKSAFLLINLYYLLVMLLLIIDVVI